MAILHCRIVINALGVKQYIPVSLNDKGKSTPINIGDIVVFNVFPSGAKIDMRGKAPFYQILPCPYCDSPDDRNHNELAHIDDRLGTKV